ncbi:MAG: DUF4062 domain-containing protein [Planctomycetota bacterium]|nr:DUF4062 domain-containing protein [Planctomycetota bacterium]
MRVFVSSTVYDLLDIRAEVSETLESLGVSAVLSEDKLSDFDSRHNANSIETCLVNVAMSDVVIVILDRRYGPTLGEFGFDDVSATHLEYRRAKDLGKSIYFYVRDRLDADYSAWKKNGKSEEFKRSWAFDKGLLLFMDEHRELDPKKEGSNWITPFTNSVDLKEGIRRQLEPRIRPQMVIDAIASNRFPFFSIQPDTEWMTVGMVPALKVSVTVKNIGGSVAFNFVPHWSDESQRANVIAIMAPNQSIPCQFVLHNAIGLESKRTFILEYDSAIGVHVSEKYEFNVIVQSGPNPARIVGAILKSRAYTNAPPLTITIDDP